MLVIRVYILIITSLNWLIQQQCLQDGSTEARRGINMIMMIICMSDFLRDSSNLKHFKYQLATNKCVFEVSKLRNPEL